MPGLGAVEVAVLAGLFFFGALGAITSRSNKLVLQRLEVHGPFSGESAPLVELCGRQQGIVSFVLTLVGVSPITIFVVTPEEICCNSTSLFGRQNQAVPLRAVSSVAAGTQKPLSYLLLACLFACIAVIGGLGVLWREGLFRFLVWFFLCAAFAAVFIWLYVINKRFFISIFPQGGPPILLSLKPNVIEGVPLDLNRALQVVKVVRDRVVLSANNPTVVSPPPMVYHPPAENVGTQQPPTAVSPPPPLLPAGDGDRLPVADFTNAAETLLQQARDLIKQGRRADAVEVLRELVSKFPESPEAVVAKATLEKAGLSV